MKCFVVVGVLVLSVFAVVPASANHWPEPFEYLNGTAPVKPEDCRRIFGLPPRMKCEMLYDYDTKFTYFIDRDRDGTVKFVQRYRTAGGEFVRDVIVFPPGMDAVLRWPFGFSK